MRPTLLSLLCCLLLSVSSPAQHISLFHLMRIHGLDDTVIYQQLKQKGWRYYGIQYDVLRKPRMFALEGKNLPYAQLYLYNYHKKALCKVELVSSDVAGFNATIRDSLGAYGFVPETDKPAPEEENLKISSSAYYVNKDAAMPIRALILYYKERRKPMVSLTIFGDE
jgi:hypothetical protein